MANCILRAGEKKAKLKQLAYWLNEFQFIQQGVRKFIFPTKYRVDGVNVL